MSSEPAYGTYTLASGPLNFELAVRPRRECQFDFASSNLGRAKIGKFSDGIHMRMHTALGHRISDIRNLITKVSRGLAGPLFRALPIRLRRSIRARRLEHLIDMGKFGSDEPEYMRLHEWLETGDTVIDIGANFGSYTLRMSELVGASGRVLAFEPVPQTFAMLVRALARANCRNVTAFNLACSNGNGAVSMSVPDDHLTGENLYQASISNSGPSLTPVLCVRVDDLPLPFGNLRLVKIDAEGQDALVIEGMWHVISQRLPILIVEHPPTSTIARLTQLGYKPTREGKSPNTVFLP